MTYSVVCSSKTGNTALLAQEVYHTLPQEQCIYHGAPAALAATAEMVFVGFWTDKGSCDEETKDFLGSLVGKRIFLFGTAGFGGAQTYFAQILGRVATYLDDSNTVVGSYMCQGKMPLSVRARYAAMEAADPEKARPMLENFDHALSHPDEADLENLHRKVIEIV